ncbi:MAG: UbiD family decarboxylase, partial [Dehalococcoidia bacterium]|nr:UbiD family decarboxylase [Dehalococcoidia bacterium]
DIDPRGPRPEVMARIRERWARALDNPLNPILVKSGPCKENIQIGDEVDLEKFPAPFLHEGDGGRYIGTWTTVITKDPDTGWVNWGMYRLMLHDKKSMGIQLIPIQHIGLHYFMKYEPRNLPMEFAVVMGTEPVTSLMSSTTCPPGVDEAAIVGAIRGEPLELVKCETVDLAVPATSEIVFEGEIRPYERMEEGPFGEFTGYRGGGRHPQPVCRVKAITHRNDPILPVSCLGVPVDDSAARRPLAAADILDDLRTRGFPVKMVYQHLEASPLLYTISTKVPYPSYAKQLAAAVWGSHTWGKMANFLIVVDEDVDVTNLNEVVWALTTRCHPENGILKMAKTAGFALLPFTSMAEKRLNLGAHVLFDCTWPKEWPKDEVPVKASFDVLWPKEIQEKVLKNWSKYGYK